MSYKYMEAADIHYTQFFHDSQWKQHAQLSLRGAAWAGLTHTQQTAESVLHLLQTTLCFSFCYCHKALTLLEACSVYKPNRESMEECAQGQVSTCTDNSEALNFHLYTENDGKHSRGCLCL